MPELVGLERIMPEKPLRILLVEDNAGDARLLREMFATERPGSFEITHLDRLQLALKHLDQGGVDVVLLDLGLPDGDGIGTVRRVRQLAPQTPLIVITGQEDDALVAEAMAEGVQDYLVKGQIETRALPRALRHATERFRLLNKTAAVNEELARRVKEKDILLSEIHHRVKNSLQVVTSLLSLECARIHDPLVVAMLMNTQTRVRSMAMIHQTLYQSKDFASVDFGAFLGTFAPTLIQSYSVQPELVSIEVDVAPVNLPLSSTNNVPMSLPVNLPISLPIDMAIPCGLIVNELISNALKHAFPNGRSGTICVRFSHDGKSHATLVVSDDGVGIGLSKDLEHSQTLGLQLVYSLAGQLGGTVNVEQSGKTRFEVRFPLKVDPIRASAKGADLVLPVSAMIAEKGRSIGQTDSVRQWA